MLTVGPESPVICQQKSANCQQNRTAFTRAFVKNTVQILHGDLRGRRFVVGTMENVKIESQSRWLDVKGAAAHLGVTVGFLRSLLWDGEVPFIRAGKRFIVDRQDLDAWAVRRKERFAA